MSPFFEGITVSMGKNDSPVSKCTLRPVLTGGFRIPTNLWVPPTDTQGLKQPLQCKGSPLLHSKCVLAVEPERADSPHTCGCWQQCCSQLTGSPYPFTATPWTSSEIPKGVHSKPFCSNFVTIQTQRNRKQSGLGLVLFCFLLSITAQAWQGQHLRTHSSTWCQLWFTWETQTLLLHLGSWNTLQCVCHLSILSTLTQHCVPQSLRQSE